MQRGGFISLFFFRVKTDDGTRGASVIWGSEPVRGGVDTEGGMTRNAEGLIRYLEPQQR